MSTILDPRGQATPADDLGDFNAMHFLVTQILNGANTATLVQVVACTNSGGLSEVGFVDVHPLVNQLDGYGHPVPHGTIYHIPYFRLQGGTNAVILDPQIGDIGIAIFADHDISTAATNAAQANPGSARRFDMADGMYLGGFRNGVPVQYVQFVAGGINVVSPKNITLQAPVIDMVGQVNQSGGTLNASESVNTPQVNASTDVSVQNLSVINHVHPDPEGGTTGGMQN